jgi:hypothetical protein
VSLVFAQTGERNQHFLKERERGEVMDTQTLIRIACGVLAVIGIIIVVMRRRGKKQ